jgi:O-acetyl-ADP-ribose deacetylase (regulator of RNase III)
LRRKVASCHRESIRIADELQLASLAFPAISTGAYGYPVARAAQIAMSSAAEAMAKATHIREVRFVLFDLHTFEHYANAARSLGTPE